MMLRRAFTLIEMIAACAALTLLMGAVMMVMTILVRDQVKGQGSALEARRAESKWIGQLEGDLQRSATVDLRKSNRQWVLTGYAALDPVTLERQCRPVEVTYIFQHASDAHDGLVIRRQRYLDDPLVEPWQELLMSGALELTLSSQEWNRALELGQTLPEPRSLPARVELAWTDSTSAQTGKRRTLVLR